MKSAFPLLLLGGAFFLYTACSAPAARPDPQPASPAAEQATGASLPQHYSAIAFAPFQYEPPHPSQYRVVIADSIIAYLVPDRNLPLVQLSFYFMENAQPTQPSEAAQMQLLSGMYRRGGSLNLSPAGVDDSLEFLSASLGGSLGNRYSTIGINCLSRDLPAVMGLMAQIYTNPGMDSLRLELLKAATLQAYSHRFDQPAAQLGALSKKVLYQSHPSLWDPLPREITAVNRPQLLERSAAFYRPAKVVIAASGDFDRDSLTTVLHDLFASWKSAPKTLPSQPTPLQFRSETGVFLSDKKITQANISMSQPFVRRPHPDYYPAMVASYILGGSGFTSRLTTRVRSDEGLAYSVYSFTDSDYDDVGTAGVALQTKVSSAPYAIAIIQQEIAKLAAAGPTAEELAGAQQALVRSLPGIFDTPASTADAFAKSEIWGRNQDHFAEYPQKIQAVTAEQVQAMIAKYFNPAHMRISIVGPVENLLQRDTVHQVSLADFGPIHQIPIDSLSFR